MKIMDCNEFLANRTQLISFPIEILGFFLMFIELFFSAVADRMENSIDWLGNRFDKLSRTFLNWAIPAAKNLIDYLLGLSFMFIIVIVITIILNESGCESSKWGGIYDPFTTIEYEYDKEPNPFKNLVKALFEFSKIAFYFTILCVGIYIILKSLSILISILNKITVGKAIGSIGLFLALVGLSGETIQVLIMDACNEIEIPNYWEKIGLLVAFLILLFIIYWFINHTKNSKPDDAKR